MPTPVFLGEATAPSSRVVVIDPGLLHLWYGDREPRDPECPTECDLRLVGPDALEAGQAYNRSWHPGYLYDIVDTEKAAAAFGELVVAKGLSASLEKVPGRVSHSKRVEYALQHGNGAGEFPYRDGVWAVAAEAEPGRPLRVLGTPVGNAEFGDRWRHIDVVIRDEEPASQEDLGYVMVEHGLLMIADADALDMWRHYDSLDGLGDFTFWGPDAPALAQEHSAGRVSISQAKPVRLEVGRRGRFQRHSEDAGRFGWRDKPLQEIRDLAESVRTVVERENLRVGLDYRPHDHYHLLREALEASAQDAAVLDLGSAQVCGFGNRWGDGAFRVAQLRDAAGRLVRLRLEVGDEKRQRLARQVLV